MGNVKYPQIKVKLVGQDGNAFAILGRVRKAMQKAKVPSAEIKSFIDEATSGSYDNLLCTCTKWVDCLQKNEERKSGVEGQTIQLSQIWDKVELKTNPHPDFSPEIKLRNEDDMEAEQEKQDFFLKTLGRERAEELQYISDNSFPRSTWRGKKTKTEVFVAAAKKEGFSMKEINLFLKLQELFNLSPEIKLRKAHTMNKIIIKSTRFHSIIDKTTEWGFTVCSDNMDMFYKSGWNGLDMLTMSDYEIIEACRDNPKLRKMFENVPVLQPSFVVNGHEYSWAEISYIFADGFND